MGATRAHCTWRWVVTLGDERRRRSGVVIGGNVVLVMEGQVVGVERRGVQRRWWSRREGHGNRWRSGSHPVRVWMESWNGEGMRWGGGWRWGRRFLSIGFYQINNRKMKSREWRKWTFTLLLRKHPRRNPNHFPLASSHKPSQAHSKERQDRRQAAEGLILK